MNPRNDFLAGGGEMGARIRALEWSKTTLGPVERWPQSLRSAVSILLPSKAQIALFWGEDLITLYNDAYRPVFGAKHPAALGKPIREAWDELWRSGLKELFDGVLSTGEAFWAKDRPFFMERHGYLEETWFDVSYDPVRDESGRVGGVFCIVGETTGRVVGERRLRALRDLRGIAQQATSVAEVYGAAAELLAGYAEDIPFALLYGAGAPGEPSPLLGWCGIERESRAAAPELPAPRGPSWPIPSDLQVLERGELERFGPLHAGPWPEPIEQVAVVPFALPGDSPQGCLVAGISPRRRIDDDYRDFLRLVASNVTAAVAAARRAEDARRRAQLLAELDRAKTTFFSNVSHEFRTPLTLMLGPVEDALADSAEPLSAPHRERLEIVHRSALRMQKLVNTLLDFSRLEAGRAQARYSATDLAAVTVDLASSFRSAVEKAGLRFTVDCPPLGEPAFVDRDLWEKIVLNLLSNAVKFTLEGEIAVELRERPGRAELTVRDTGTGIPAGELPKIFERFRRIEGARSRTHEGTGIGLALVQELVKLHGGTVEARSVEGRGSAFVVSIPLGSAHLPADRIQAEPALDSTALGAEPFVEEALRWLPGEIVPPADVSATGRPRIVWADDNGDMREYVRRLLARHYDVEAVPDGEAALAAIRANPPDLVLSDIMMPKLDGFGLLREMRAVEGLRYVPVILLSARAGEEAITAGLEAGADDYLAKPFSARELLTRVAAQLRASDLRAENRRQQALVDRIVSSAPVAIAVLTGPALRFTMANPAYQAIVGAEPGLLGRTYADAFPGPAWRGAEAGIREVMLTGRPWRIRDFESELPGRTGPTWWEGECLPLPDALGGVDSVLVITWEVTERKRAELALRESERTLRDFADTAPATLWITDPDGACSFLSRGWYQATGQDEFEALGLGWTAAVHPEDRQRAARALLEAHARREEFSLNFRLRAADGSFRWVLDAGRPRFGAGGEFLGFVGSVIDVHEEKQIEAALRASEERYRAIVESQTERVCRFRPDGAILFVNGAYARSLGATPETLAGESFWKFVSEPDRDAVRAVLDRLTPESPEARVENRLETSEGVRWMLWTNRALAFDEQGRVLEAQSSGIDITDRKRAEEALREADRRKDEFIATLSHELRNPLAPLRNALQLLRMNRAREASIEAIHEMMERQVNHLVRLVDDLLEMSRISRGALELRRERVEVATIVRNAVETSDFWIREAGHVLDVSLPDAPLWLEGDPVRLAQILSNLLNNAARYTPGGGRISVHVEAEEGRAVVSVRDTGAGFPPETADRLFDMFTRGEGSIGLGIGLALSRRLAEMHGGTLEASSPGPGRGATFTVRLPLAGEQSAPPARDVPDAAAATATIGRKRILVVDDNRDAAESLQMILELLGADVLLATDGREALEAFDAYDPAVVLLDIGMPGMDGYEVARAIRAGFPERRPAIVALSGWGQEADRRRGREAGFDHHLVKPADIGALQALLDSLEANRDHPSTVG